MDKEEILSNYHKSLAETIHSREVELNKFIGIIIPALVVFCFGAWKYFEFKNELTGYLLLCGGYLAGVLLCIWGMLLALKLGYVHRCIQMVMSKLEKDIYLTEYIPSCWREKSWKIVIEKKLIKRIYFRKRILGEKINELLPEVYQLHFYMFAWCIFLMSVFSLFIVTLCSIAIWIKVVIFMVLSILAILQILKIDKNIKTYYDKLKKQKEALKLAK